MSAIVEYIILKIKIIIHWYIYNFYKNKTAEPEQTSIQRDQMRPSVNQCNDWIYTNTQGEMILFVSVSFSLSHLIVNNREKSHIDDEFCLIYTRQRSLPYVDRSRQATLWLRCKYNMDALVSIYRRTIGTLYIKK